MSANKRIACNVSECAHNSLKDCRCKLEEIKVCACTAKDDENFEQKTACGSYHYIGNLNAKGELNEDS